MKRLIINADDFGMSPAVNAGIIRAHRDGIVTSATVLANGAAFPEAVRLARAHPSLRVGVHLDIVEGRPVAPLGQVRSLLSTAGTFVGGTPALAARLWLGRIDRGELVREFCAQIARVVDAGLRPTHIDSHMHAHCLPQVLDAALEAAARFGIRRLRWPRESRIASTASRRPSWASWLRLCAVSSLARVGRARLQGRSVRWPDGFVGLRYMGTLDAAALVDLIAHLPAGTTELMCHPADGDQRGSHIARGSELAALTAASVRRAVQDHGVELSSFAELDDLAVRHTGVAARVHAAPWST